MLKSITNTKNSLMMKVGDKTKTVDSEYDEVRKQFVSESEIQLLVVKNIQKQEEHMQGMERRGEDRREGRSEEKRRGEQNILERHGCDAESQ